MCCLLMAAARFNFSFSAQHIPGVHSKVADALPIFIGRSSGGWGGWQKFRWLGLSARPNPVTIPQKLLTELTFPR